MPASLPHERHAIGRDKCGAIIQFPEVFVFGSEAGVVQIGCDEEPGTTAANHAINEVEGLLRVEVGDRQSPDVDRFERS